MGIITTHESDDYFASQLSDELCFACYSNREITRPFVWWRLNEGSIVLHPECAVTLGVHLLKDAASIQETTGKKIFPGFPAEERE